MLKPGDIAIVSGARTPFGRYCGKLKDFTAQELGAIAAKGAIQRAKLEPKNLSTSFSATRSRLLATRCMGRDTWDCARDFRSKLRR